MRVSPGGSVMTGLATGFMTAILLLADARTARAAAQVPEDDLPTGNELPRIEPIAIADAYFAYHDTAPPYREQTSRNATALSTGARHGEFAVNLVGLGARLQHAKLTGTIVLHAGTSVDALYARQPDREIWKHIQLANVGWRTGDFHLEAGVLPSLVGRESFVSVHNWNYTRTMNADATPYFMAGARVTYKLSPSVTLNGTVFNGWSTYRNDDGSPSGQVRVAFQPSDSFSIENSFLFGREPSVRGDKPFRLYDDLVAYLKVHNRIELALQGWIGREQGARIEDRLRGDVNNAVFKRDPYFYGAAFWARWRFGDTTYVAGRVEGLVDRSGVVFGQGARGDTDRFGAMTAIGQRILGGTITLGWQPHPSFLARVEALHRISDEPYFAGGEANDPKSRNTTFVISAAFAL